MIGTWYMKQPLWTHNPAWPRKKIWPFISGHSVEIHWWTSSRRHNLKFAFLFYLLSSEMKDSADLYVTTTMKQQLLMFFFEHVGLYKFTFTPRSLTTFLCCRDHVWSHILTFILEVNTVTLQMIWFRCLTLFAIIVLLLAFQVCRSNTTLVQQWLFYYYYRQTCLFFHTVL